MNVDLQQLAVALLMLVPGFITTAVQRAFAPRRFTSDTHWVVSSLLVALPLNLLILVPFLLVGLPAVGALRLKDLPQIAQNATAGAALIYLLLLYVLSLVVGLMLGRFPVLRLRALLNRSGLVAFAQHPSVWDRIFEVRQPSDRPAAWLCVRFDSGRTILGHLRNSSEHIDKEQPFEVYLEEPHEWQYGRWVPLETAAMLRGRADGVYTRILPTQVVEFYFAPIDWKP